MSVKRPSLAESMRQAVQPEAPAVSPAIVAAPAAELPRQLPPLPPEKPAGFFAATRAGKKKVTATVSPEMRRDLKSLAAAKDTTTEALLLEAITDLLSKHGAKGTA